MRKRDKQIVVRLSDEELAQVKEKVEKSGMSQQDYIIKSLTKTKVVNTDTLTDVLVELKREGNNLNQLARQANMNGWISEEDLADAVMELKKTWRSLRQSIANLV